MSGGDVEPLVKPFYLDAAPGRRFCLAFEPAGTHCAGGVLYVHPFAEEMNKSRRMAAQQARELARQGYRVLLIDLYGCGDSDGDFADARWGLWLDDLERAVTWLRRTSSDRVILWGLRLGATLAMAFAARTANRPVALHLWQPVVNGEVFLTQFLRLRVASEMIAGERQGTGTKDLRAQWGAERSVEVGGYEIAPQLARAIDDIRIADLPATGAPVHWYEVVADSAVGATPATQRTVEAMRHRGAAVELHVVNGAPFWATVEITECPQLLKQTASVLGHCQ